MQRRLILFIVLSAFLLIFADGPHPVYVEIRNAANQIPLEGDVTFQAWLLSNPSEILDENTTDCYYPAFSSYVKVNCGQFSTWNNTDIIHLEVTEISSGDQGSGEYQLTYDASQFFSIEQGGIYLGNSGNIELDLPAQFNTDEDNPFVEDFSNYITGIYVTIEYWGTENVSVSITDNMVSFTPAENWFGSEVITFEVISPSALSAIDSVEVVVDPVNDPPEFNLPPQLQFNEDGSYNEDISGFVSDVENDPITLSATGSEHITAQIEGNNLIMTADANWNGSELITLTASDNQTRESTDIDIMVIVNPVNDAPVINLPEQKTFQAESSAVMDFSDYIQDIDGDFLDISFYGEDDLDISVDGYEVTFTYDAGWHGSDEIIFTVDDNAMRISVSDTMTVNIFYPEDTILSCDQYEVDDGNDLEVTVNTTAFFEEWSEVSFNLEFNYDPLVLDFVNHTLTGTILENGTLSVTEVEPGQLEIAYLHYLPISGEGAFFKLNFNTVCYGESILDLDDCVISSGNLENLLDGYVIVNNVGLEHPPVADAGDDFGVLSGGSGTLDGSNSYDPDGDTITWLWNAPPELIIDDETAPITTFTAPIVTENTEFIVSLTVSDGNQTGNDIVIITVNYQNHPPEIALPEQFEFNEDESLEIDFDNYVTDLDGDELTLSVTGNTSIQVDIDELMVEFSATENWFGSETLTFTVDDGIMTRIEDDVIVNVTAVNDLPHADAGMDQNGRDGESITLDGTASWDVETQDLEYTWIAPAGVMLDDPYSQTPSFTAPQVVDPEEFEFTLQVSDGELMDEDLVIITIQDDEPVLLHVDLLENNNALFTWFAPGSGGSGQEIEQGFEGVVPPQGWTNIDYDEDGLGWYIYVQNPHSGSSSLGSQSYSPSSGALTPDNWFISPPLQVGGLSYLNYWIAAQDEYFPAEHYSVLISTEGTEIENFTDVLIEETLIDDSWQERSISLQDWAGSTINIAWRHHDVTNQFILKLDDVQVYNSQTREVEYSENFDVSDVKSNLAQPAFRDRELMGYRVFLDDIEQGEVDIRQFLFEDVVGPHVASVQALYDDGESEIVCVDFDHTATEDELPLVTELGRIYPNPFNPETKIEFSLDHEQMVDVSVFNIKGQRVAKLIDDSLPAGNHSVTWKADNLPSGIYFLAMHTDQISAQRKIILLK